MGAPGRGPAPAEGRLTGAAKAGMTVSLDVGDLTVMPALGGPGRMRPSPAVSAISVISA
jgi:hypothetical protein